MEAEERDLWFRLKHKILPTKDKLCFGGITDNDKCLLCNMHKETIEHIFIECQHCNEAWLFVENIVKNYLKNRNFYLFDRNRILGVNIKNDVVLLLIGKLLKTIWNIRCSVARKGCNDYINILYVCKRNLKKFIFMEKSRLYIDVFDQIYARNRARKG